MSLVERVAETIDETAGHVLRGQDGIWRVDPRAIAQAVLEALGFITCQTCGGGGKRKHYEHMEGLTNEPVACPNCLGLGVVPSEAMIERAVTEFRKAQTDSTVTLPEFVYDGMRAALLEAFGGDE